jgi:peptidoglycan/LPS O-acetylase OafA/YrhL
MAPPLSLGHCPLQGTKNMNGAAHDTTGRFDALDGWRGVCACFVVLFHFHGWGPLYTSSFVRDSYLFVDFFFVLSGFVIAWNYGNRLSTWPEMKRFLILRLGRVYPLHLFMLLCFLAYETARSVFALHHPGVSETFAGATEPGAIMSNLLLVQSLHVHDMLTWNVPSWSISTEYWTYFVFALVSLCFGLRNTLLLAVAIVAPLLIARVSTTGMNITYDWGLVRCIFGFALGVACSRIYRRWPTVMHGASQAQMTLLELLVILAVVLFVCEAGMTGLSILAPFLFAAAVLVFAAEGGWVSGLFRTRALRWLGTVSYSIYMTHYLLVVLVPTFFKHALHRDYSAMMPIPGEKAVEVFGRNDLEGTLFYLAVLALTLVVSGFTYRWIEKPGRDWSRRWAARPAVTERADPAVKAEAAPSVASRVGPAQ